MDTILLDPGISPDAVALDRMGTDLILTLDEPNTTHHETLFFR